MLVTVGVAIVLQGVVRLSVGLYRRRYHYGSFDEVSVLGLCIAIVAVGDVRVASIHGGALVPRSVPVLAAFPRARVRRRSGGMWPDGSKTIILVRRRAGPSRSSSSAPATRATRSRARSCAARAARTGRLPCSTTTRG